MTITLVLVGWMTARKIEQGDLEKTLWNQREAAIRELTLLGSRLEAEVNSSFYLISGLASYIGINPGITAEDFRIICRRMLDAKPELRHVAAAPDMVIRYIYPLEGNEAAIGLAYAAEPAQRDAAMRVKEIGQPVVAGPVELRQGGEVIIGRFPVYTTRADGEESFWGILATVLETEVLYESVGLNAPGRGIEVAIRGRDSMGAKGEIFYGSPSVFEQTSVKYTVRLLSGTWQIAALPIGGWAESAPRKAPIRVTTAGYTALAIGIIWLLFLYDVRADNIRRREAEVEQIKNRFLANMSHEVRTPLNGICGLAELLEIGCDDEDPRESAALIRASAETLTRLLDDVLELSDASSGEGPREVSEVYLDSFIGGIVAPLQFEARRKQISFTVAAIPEEVSHFWTDPAMLRQILWNLLSNAVKFTETGEVTLEVVRVSEGTLSFRVTDTGIGIDPSHFEAIFKEFTQEDASDTRRYGGAGLGLAIVKRFVHRLGGTITVQSEKGVGSQFEVILPDRR